MNALDTLMPVLVERGFTLYEAVELLARFMEEEIPLYLECIEEDGSSHLLCSLGED